MNGAVIKERMKALHLTQEMLAKKASISQASLSAIINGKVVPKDSTKQAIADALQLPLESLSDSGEAWQNWPQNFACPRCGSRAVSEFCNHADGAVRLSCGFCGLDTGEQKDRPSAMRLFASYQSAEGLAEPMAVRVYTLTELLNPSALDSDDVRPVWFENQGLFCCPALLQYGLAERERSCVRVLWFNSYGAKSYDLDKYGYAWRCWTEKPTEAQSLAVDWLL